MRLLTTNLVTETGSTVTASSQNANFPASNLQHMFRSKRWRSSGTFVIDNTNKYIDFLDANLGTEKHATLTPGTYSVSSLITHIQTQMALAGSHTYTVTYSATTGLWTVSSSNGFFSLLNLTGVNNAAATFPHVLGFPATDKTGSNTYTGSTIAIHTKESVVFDFQTTEEVNSAVVLWPKEDGIRLSTSAVIKVEANATNTWASPAVSQTLTIDDTFMTASHFFSTDQSYRYWRVTIQDPTNANLFVELGVVWLGTSVDFNEAENGFKFSLKDESNIAKTEYGHKYVDEYPLTALLEFNYSYVQYANVAVLDQAFRSNGARLPVIAVLDETATVFDKDHFLVYGQFNPSFTLNHVSYDLFSGACKIEELG